MKLIIYEQRVFQFDGQMRWRDKRGMRNTIWSNSIRYRPNEVSSSKYAEPGKSNGPGLHLISFPREFIFLMMIESIPLFSYSLPWNFHFRSDYVNSCARFIHKFLFFCILLLHFAIQFFSVFVFIAASNRHCWIGWMYSSKCEINLHHFDVANIYLFM